MSEFNLVVTANYDEESESPHPEKVVVIVRSDGVGRLTLRAWNGGASITKVGDALITETVEMSPDQWFKFLMTAFAPTPEGEER